MGGLKARRGIEECGADHKDQQRDEGGTGDATEQARESVRMHGEQVGNGKEHDREHETRHLERKPSGEQRLEHLKRGGRGARNGEARTDCQVIRRHEHVREQRVHARGEVADSTREANCNNAEHGQSNAGDKEADHGGNHGLTRLQTQ